MVLFQVVNKETGILNNSDDFMVTAEGEIYCFGTLMGEDYFIRRAIGVKSIDGEHIFEGDVVNDESCGEMYVVRYHDNHCAFMLDSLSGLSYPETIVPGMRLAVIADIYDAPEFLED